MRLELEGFRSTLQVLEIVVGNVRCRTDAKLHVLLAYAIYYNEPLTSLDSLFLSTTANLYLHSTRYSSPLHPQRP
jgi:hypothetical protein